jgi:anti-sigma factor RsiW
VHIQLPGPLVAVVSGALVGLALVGLTSAGLGLCSSWRGTSSCGQPGLLLLLAITALVIALGALLLGAGRVSMPGSTSLLGTGLLVVLILLALIPALDQWWVVIVVPVLAALTYLAAWWLTTTYAEPGERSR